MYFRLAFDVNLYSLYSLSNYLGDCLVKWVGQHHDIHIKASCEILRTVICICINIYDSCQNVNIYLWPECYVNFIWYIYLIVLFIGIEQKIYRVYLWIRNINFLWFPVLCSAFIHYSETLCYYCTPNFLCLER